MLSNGSDPDGPDALAGRGVVVVLSWHGKADTLSCVESLDPERSPSAVLVVDNGSFDGVLEEAERRWPAVRLLQTGENLGFAGGMNAGIRWALERGARHVTVLNNDTVLPAGAIAALEESSGHDRAVSPEVFYLDDHERLWFGGGTIDQRTLLPHHIAAAQLSSGGRLRASTVLAGCCVTASAEVWRRVGLFDERFFLYFEDSEWSVRARAHDVELLVDTGVAIDHRVSASFTRSAQHVGSYYYARNGLLFNRLLGGSPLSRWRFLRSYVLPATAGQFRQSGLRPGIRALFVLVVALAHYAVHRFGRAPRWLEGLTSRW